MIKLIKFRNFQSHHSTSIECHEGITTFIGQSDSGKTAMMRGISSVILRSPFYLRNDTENGEVEINFDNCDVSRNVEYSKIKKCSNCKEDLKGEQGNIVVCVKCGEVNQIKVDKDYYILNGTRIEKFRVKLPEELLKAIKITPITFVDIEENLNFHNQHSDFFFIGASYAGGARNKIISSLIVDSDKVDVLIQKIGGNLREASMRMNVLESDILLMKSVVKDTEVEVEELKVIKKWIDVNSVRMHIINTNISKLQSLKTVFDSSFNVLKYKQHIEKIRTGLNKFSDKLKDSRSKIKDCLDLEKFSKIFKDIKIFEFKAFDFNFDFESLKHIRMRIVDIEDLKKNLSEIRIIKYKPFPCLFDFTKVSKLDSSIKKIKELKYNFNACEMVEGGENETMKYFIDQKKKLSDLIVKSNCPITNKPYCKDCQDVLQEKCK